MTKFATLNQLNPDLDLDLTRDRVALYRGGQAVKERARRFLQQRPGEPETLYQARLNEIQFRPYLGAILDNFANMLFKSRPVAVPMRDGRELANFESDFYSRFKTNADLAGTDVDTIAKELFTDAATTGLAWVAVHDPIDTSGLLEPPANKADWEARGLGEFWIERLEPGSVIDWQKDATGNLKFVIVHRVETPRVEPTAERDRVVETWTIYTASYVETFRIDYNKKEPPKPDAEVESVAFRAHNFGRVPVLCMQFNPAQHLAARLELPQVAHTLALSAETWSLARCAFAQLICNVTDPETFEAPRVMGGGVGLVLGKDERASWLEPNGAHLDALDRRIRCEKDELFRVASAMALGAENNAATVGRSADSKAIDAEASRVALRAFASKVRELISRLYEMLSNVRGELVEWRIDGLDDLDVVAYLQALKLLGESVDGAPHSPSARAALESKAVEALLPEAKPEQKSVWRMETLNAIANEPSLEEREAQQFAAMHRAVNDSHQHDDAA